MKKVKQILGSKIFLWFIIIFSIWFSIWISSLVRSELFQLKAEVKYLKYQTKDNFDEIWNNKHDIKVNSNIIDAL
jgi:cell division protein FtsL